MQDLETCYSVKSHEEQYNAVTELLQNAHQRVTISKTSFTMLWKKRQKKSMYVKIFHAYFRQKCRCPKGLLKEKRSKEPTNQLKQNKFQ